MNWGLLLGNVLFTISILISVVLILISHRLQNTRLSKRGIIFGFTAILGNSILLFTSIQIGISYYGG